MGYLKPHGYNFIGEGSIARRPTPQAPAKDKNGPRVNEEITAQKVRVVAPDGEMLGVLSPEAAIQAAYEAGLDLVEVSPNVEPPVCKILDYGKFKYEAQKKKAEARKKQKVINVKEIKMRPGIDEHDYQTKMKAMNRFVDDGDKVKVTIRFRGREVAHQELGAKVLNRVRTDLDEKVKVELFPRMEGRQMIMILAPR